MKTHTIFFSPTRTGATVAQTIRDEMQQQPGENIDLTKTAIEKAITADDVAIIAMPVYGGRIPALAAERFQAVHGNNAKAVAIVIFGNAKYDDALLELTDLCTKQGFQVIAAAAFVGEHSFATDEFPIAIGRPDAEDLQAAKTFAKLIDERLGKKGPSSPPTVPGNRPYRPAMNIPPLAATDSDPADCTRCGQCAAVCPTSAITMTGTIPQTDGEKCIWCCACVKVCPNSARKIALPKILETAERLYKTFKTRQNQEWFLPPVPGK